MPKGVFYSRNRLTKKSFIPYKEFRKNNLSANIVNSFELIEAKNPNKATINTKLKTIKIDNKIADIEYKPCLVFLLAHELGHTIFGGDKYMGEQKIFDAEIACDSFASNYMLSHGYNPTQIVVAKEMLLSRTDRKKCIHDDVIEKNNRR